MSKDKIDPEMKLELETEFSRLIDVTAIGAKGRHYKYQATDEELTAIAQRYSILNLNDLRAECKVTPLKRKEYILEGSFWATVVQACVISLEPIEEQLSGEFKVKLLQGQQQSQSNKAELDFEFDDEDVEYITSNQIDVGEIILQNLSLEINPYPRKTNATGKELGYKIVHEDEAELNVEKKNPFDILKSLNIKT